MRADDASTIFVEGAAFKATLDDGRQNALYISPLSGRVWATWYRSPQRLWYCEMIPASGEPQYPHLASVPGTLLPPFATRELIEALPRPLLLRELDVLEGLTSSPNYGTIMGVQLGDFTMQSSAILQEIAALRHKVAAGTITDEELRRAIVLLREERVNAAARAAAARKPKVDPEALLESFLS